MDLQDPYVRRCITFQLMGYRGTKKVITLSPALTRGTNSQAGKGPRNRVLDSIRMRSPDDISRVTLNR